MDKDMHTFRWLWGGPRSTLTLTPDYAPNELCTNTIGSGMSIDLD